MSTLVTENLQDSGGSVPVATVRRGSAKAWAGVEINGTTTGSFNVSSVTDVGTGAASVSMTSGFGSTSYSVENSVHIAVTTAHSFTSTRSSSSAFTHAHYVTGAAADPVRYHGSVHGDLA